MAIPNGAFANGVINAELFHHVRFTQAAEPELAAPPAYPLFLDPLVAEMTTYMRRSLLDYLHSDTTFSIKFYKRSQVTEKLIIDSTAYSQRRGNINRQSNRVCYQTSDNQGFMFAKVVTFVEVLHMPQRYLAWVRSYDGVDIDRAKRVAREGRFRWIEVDWIKSLFGILRDDVNLIVTDANIFD
jgi:hypothetical protein